MDSEKIKHLLDRYWNAETTLEEEQLLKDYFEKASHDEFKEEVLLFRYFRKQKEKALPEDPVFNTTRMPRRSGTVRIASRKFVRNTMRIAAGLIVVITALWFMHSELTAEQTQPSVSLRNKPIEDTYEDPQKAFNETKKALLMISKTFGAAEEQARKINIFNEAREQIEGNTHKKKEQRDS